MRFHDGQIVIEQEFYTGNVDNVDKLSTYIALYYCW